MLIVVPFSVLVSICITWLIGVSSTYRYGSYVGASEAIETHTTMGNYCNNRPWYYLKNICHDPLSVTGSVVLCAFRMGVDGSGSLPDCIYVNVSFAICIHIPSEVHRI